MSITYSQAGLVHRDSETRFNPANISPRPAVNTTAHAAAVIIEPRQLIRDCLARALRAASGHDVVAVSSVDEWLNICEQTPASVVLLSGFDQGGGEDLCQKIQRLSQAKKRLPTVILADAEDIGDVVSALNKGVKGYIPTNISLDVAVEAMRLVRAGGVFVPASCLKATLDPAAARSPKSLWQSMFTVRQAAVVDALRQGKANKTIAYELQLQESTVKVHIRNIMKKLKAKNRTEVAYMVTKILTNQKT